MRAYYYAGMPELSGTFMLYDTFADGGSVSVLSAD